LRFSAIGVSDAWVLTPTRPPQLRFGQSIHAVRCDDSLRVGPSSRDTVKEVGGFRLDREMLAWVPATYDEQQIADSPPHAIRSTVRDFAAFVAALESAVPDVLRPGADVTIARHLAHQLPVTAAECLFIHLGLDVERRHVDLVPGTTVRVLTSSFQQLLDAGKEPLDPDEAPLGVAYLPAGETTATVVRGRDGRLGFGLFPDPKFAPHVPRTAEGASNLADLDASTFWYRHLRLVYPANLGHGADPVPVGFERAPYVVGARTRVELETATVAVAAGNPAPAGTAVARLNGRSAWVVEFGVQLSVHGTSQPVSVPVGTTVRQLVERQVPLPRPARVPLAGITLDRLVPVAGRRFSRFELDPSAQPARPKDVYRVRFLAKTSELELLEQLRSAGFPDLVSSENLASKQWRALATANSTVESAMSGFAEVAVPDGGSGQFPAAYVRIDLDGSPRPEHTMRDAYDLTLLPGDRVGVTIPELA
jgi:hypothetical protein